MTRTRKGTMAQHGLDPLTAARKRIATCERFGLDIDPRDADIVRLAKFVWQETDIRFNEGT